MATRARPKFTNVAELIEALGGVPLERVRLTPPPGRATVDHLCRLNDRRRWVYELIDSTVVGKSLSLANGCVSAELAGEVHRHVRASDLGVLTNVRCPYRLAPGTARCPSLAFASWGRLGRRTIPDVEWIDGAPDVAVEFHGPGNTDAEWRRVRGDYFAAGLRQFWLVNATDRSVCIFTDVDRSGRFTDGDALEPDGPLAGLRVQVADLFRLLRPGA